MSDTIRGKVLSTFHTVIKEAASDGGERRIRGFASTSNLDRVREVIEPTAFANTLKTFNQNPIMLWMHDTRQPVGHFDQLEIREDGLWVSGVIGRGFHPADRAWEMIEQRVLRAFSVGFREIDHEIREHRDEQGNLHEILHITDLELLEISLVSIPANREALFTMEGGKLLDIEVLPEVASTLGLADDELLIGECDRRGLSPASRGVISYRKYPVQEKEAAWSGQDARQALAKWATQDGKVDFSRFRWGFTYVPDGEADKVTAYKLPHHTVTDAGIVTNLRGVRAALAALAGARGGVDIPEDSKRTVYNHLARHVRADFGEEVPAFDELVKLTEPELLAALTTTDEEVLSFAEQPEAQAPRLSQDQQLVLSAFSSAVLQLEGTTNDQTYTFGKGNNDGPSTKFFFMPAPSEGASYEDVQKLAQRLQVIEQRLKDVDIAIVKLLRLKVEEMARLEAAGRANGPALGGVLETA